MKAFLSVILILLSSLGCTNQAVISTPTPLPPTPTPTLTESPIVSVFTVTPTPTPAATATPIATANSLAAPNGKTVALMRGNGYGDACFSGWGLVFYTLDQDIQLGKAHYLHTFSGFLDDAFFNDVYPVNAPGLERPGYWEDSTNFITGLSFTCLSPALCNVLATYQALKGCL